MCVHGTALGACAFMRDWVHTAYHADITLAWPIVHPHLEVQGEELLGGQAKDALRELLHSRPAAARALRGQGASPSGAVASSGPAAL